MTYFSDVTYVCTFIDNPITINGNSNLADVLQFPNKSRSDHYHFLYRYTKEVNGTKEKELFKMIDYYTKLKTLKIWEGSQEKLEFPIVVNDTINLKKVGVMTLEDSWLDEKNCTLKRKGSSCKNEEKAVFDKIPSELANKGCEAIYYNIYDYFYGCDYNDSISVSGGSGPIKNSTSTSTSSSKSSTIETAITIISVSEKNIFKSKSFIILSIGIPVLIILAVFPLVHYYLVTKSKLKEKSESSSGFSDYTQSTNDTSSSEISDKDSSDSTSK